MLNYFKIGKPTINDEGEAAVSIRIKWWAFPFLYFKVFKADYTASLYGWFIVIIKLPGIWYKWYKTQGE
jgi:hypothetical protein